MDILIAILVGVLVPLLTKDAERGSAYFIVLLLRLALIITPIRYRARLSEEWHAELSGIDGLISRLFFALDLVRGAISLWIEAEAADATTSDEPPPTFIVTTNYDGLIEQEVVQETPPILHSPQPIPLTEREIEILKWTAIGKTAWEIGSILKISERTVNFHLQNIMGKLGVHNKTHAAAKAMSIGIIDP